MAQQVIQLDREKRSCSICLDLLKDPVTIPCGHSYCMSCIKDCWDKENEKETCSCPQCRHSYSPRPVLKKNTMLAELVEELKKVELQAASPDHSYAGPGEVACDFCPGRKLKAFKSCLVCMASFCEQHLQPHYSIAPLKKHKLVEATLKLQENICSRHDEVMKIFCRTDQQSICYLCSMDDHKGHDTVSAAAERAERQTELGTSRQTIQQRVQDREKDVNVLQQRVEVINVSADQAVRDSEKIFTELVRLIEERSSEVKQQIRSQQISEVSRAEELEEKLQQEITELRRKDSELEKLSHTEDHLHFLNKYPDFSSLNEFKDLPSFDIHPLCSFEDVTVAVSEVRDKLEADLSEEWTKISLAVATVEVLPPISVADSGRGMLNTGGNMFNTGGSAFGTADTPFGGNAFGSAFSMPMADTPFGGNAFGSAFGTAETPFGGNAFRSAFGTAETPLSFGGSASGMAETSSTFYTAETSFGGFGFDTGGFGFRKGRRRF